MALSKVNPNLITQGASGRKNLFINGGFDVWQRGTSLAGATSYLADRWFNGTTETQSRQAFTVGQTEVGGNPTYYHRGSSGSTEWYGLKQRIENVGTTAGREVTLSYWAKGSSAFTNAPYRGQNFGSGGSSDVNAALSTANITTSWARYTHTFTLPSISGKTVGAGSYLQINLIRANVNNITIDLANCQLELGSVATDFEHRSYGEELHLCQRYYEIIAKPTAADDSPYFGIGHGVKTDQINWYYDFKAEKRAPFTLIVNTVTNGYYGKNHSSSFNKNTLGVTMGHQSLHSIMGYMTNISGVAEQSTWTMQCNGAGCLIAVSAEL
jgi:hypothetical protein